MSRGFQTRTGLSIADLAQQSGAFSDFGFVGGDAGRAVGMKAMDEAGVLREKLMEADALLRLEQLHASL